MQENAAVIAFVGLLVFLAHLFAAIFERTRIPDVLFLVIIGMILGPITHLVSVSQFGAVGPVFTTVTLIIILFHGGTALKLSTLGSTLGRATVLAAVSFSATMAATTGIGIWLVKLELIPALMLGAIAASTSEAIVIPLARQLDLKEESRAILSLESSVNDLFSIVVTVALLAAYELGQISIGSVTSKLVSSFVVAIIFGVVSALAWAVFHERVPAIRSSMLTTPAFVFVVFGVVEMLGFNGAIAALAFGVTIANISSFNLRLVKRQFTGEPVGITQTEEVLFGEIAFIMKTFFFVYLGISLQLTSPMALALGVAIVVVAFVLRIPAVKVSLGKSTSTSDASIIAVMIPKGLAAVALASLPMTKGVSGGEGIMNITYATVLLSMVMTSAMVLLLCRTKLANYYGWVLSPGSVRSLFHGRQFGDASQGYASFGEPEGRRQDGEPDGKVHRPFSASKGSKRSE